MNLKYLKPVKVIGKSTYKEIIRDRLLYGILVVAFLVTATSFFLATVSFDQNNRVLENVGLASIHIFTFAICVFVATTSMNKDLERRTLYLLFPKPIRRSQYILGKFLGLIYLLITTLVILGGLFTLGAYLTDHSLLMPALINLAYTFMEVSFLTALAILFGSFTASLNATLYTVGFFLIGHSLTAVRDYIDKSGNGFAASLIHSAYYILPNLEKFDIRQPVLYGMSLPTETVVWSVIYWIIYTALLLYLAIQVMKAQEV